jgi:hypothetical protein
MAVLVQIVNASPRLGVSAFSLEQNLLTPTFAVFTRLWSPCNLAGRTNGQPRAGASLQ